MFAEIIVDVPLMQTDRPYTYHIPEEFETMLQVGMRVHVPFGNGNRLIQGIVVGFSETSETETKDIVEVLDFSPVLNVEQLWLADELRKTVFAYKISLLKAMLPNLLNSSYDKVLSQGVGLSVADKRAIFGSQERVHFSDLDLMQQARVMRLAQAGKIVVDYVAKDKKQIKTEKWYRVHQEQLQEIEISNRAKKRQALKETLLQQAGSALLANLRQDFSAENIRYFQEQGAIEVWEEEVNRAQIYFDHVKEAEPLQLNSEQATAVREIVSEIGHTSRTYLLEGVTGSGKTEVYLQVIDHVVKQGKTAIMLVPEISLTPQMTNRFIARFGQKVAILHSGLSDGEKYDEWRKIERGAAQVVVGARSAIFAPLTNIGAIIIDEEHEATYKQDSNPRYHARDVATLRAEYNQAVLVLGSATPSLESRARASKGLYGFLKLTQRANPQAQIPSVEIVDFRDYIGQLEASTLTPVLLEKIKEKRAKNEQVVLLLNRRGYSSFMMCRDCGAVDECPNCDISLTLHMDTKTMNCHYCGFQKDIPRFCPNCHSQAIRYYGTGTQKAYDELMALLPETRILRMDVDTTRKKGSHEKILTAFGRGEADILLGTQMIAKGLDFPNVTLVGVLNADTALNLPDFRSAERTFQLLTQVAGRAGRADKAGEVVIQTYNPTHYAISFAKEQDYEGFYQYEMGMRRFWGYPPYYYTVGVTLSHKSEEVVVKKAFEVMKMLRDHLSDQIQLLGPTPKPIARTHNLYHYQMIVKYRKEPQLSQVLNRVLDWTQKREHQDLRVAIDHEPQNMM
ncbi:MULTISPECIES: primosomal protein N' [unclassified Streptococcus]|uniref:primosomal protein N' n=1 Tax=unclassified Streptococcus TaxID=2608887 RepID=UPI001072612B|nr:MULTISPECIES: primosomal protein N' [unclassified Streptococcus]MBF0787865.1 primosomal protein N' [Streptococcus sp. 19428wC2_LYSM12]MCQ9211148.1 primosomal protein N' [Streptococcus sp. B01]MCQ9214423.1 primosomal protein N' [Streptococcus sp. O1]TFV05115.1 primosomal protein N' [Streptococcus sp. LYSM12]